MKAGDADSLSCVAGSSCTWHILCDIMITKELMKVYKWSMNDEQRVILSFSKLAEAVIDQDMLQFQSKSMSAFVCRIFENYYRIAEASISKTLSHKEGDLWESLKEIPEETRRAVVNILVEQEKKKLEEKYTEMAKGDKNHALRLRNKTVGKIQECEQFEAEH